MIHSLLLRTLCVWFGLLSPPVRGWEIGKEYLYEYGGLLVTSLKDAQHQSGAVQIVGKLTVQSIDEETLMLKLSEIRVTRDGNYDGRERTSDPIWLPVSLADGENIVDSLHLLSPFAVIHNKGSITNLVVERAEPVWSVNIKKAVASHLQLDVAGVRSGLDIGVFGERNAALNSLEDGVTGDCLTTLRVIQLPYYQAIQNQPVESHQIIAEACRSTKIYEITKVKDFNQCQSDPLQLSMHPIISPLPLYNYHFNDTLQRFAAYRYLACGTSSQKTTVVHMEGVGELNFYGPFTLTTKQTISLVLLKNGPIHDFLPPLSQPKLLDELTFTADESPTAASAEEAERVLGTLQEVARTLFETTSPEVDVTKKLSFISETIFHLDAAQLRQIWVQSYQSGNATTRDLFIDCAAASGGHTAVIFLLDLIERGELQSFQAIWTLMSAAHSVRTPNVSLLQRFVGIVRSEPARISKPLRRTALTVAAHLLYTSCVLFRANCNPDAQVITEEFLPILVRELESAQTAVDRLTIILALGELGVEDVLLLLVPYIRGEDVPTRVAAILSLKRLMDSSSQKVIPLLSSLADNVAERSDIRMTAISMLLFHHKTPAHIWKKIALLTWFEPSQQVRAFTCDIVQSFSAIHSSGDEESPFNKARSVVGLVRPCVGRLEYEHYATIKGNSEWLLSLLGFWRLSDSLLPVYFHHELFHQLGSFRLNLAQVSIWNYNMKDVWNLLLGRESPQPSGPKLNDIWDQLSLRFRPNDQRTGLFHVRFLGSTLQGFFNLEDIDRFNIEALLKGHLNIRLVKFQQLVDIRAGVPTELGLPAQFSFLLSGLASIQGHIVRPEINLNSTLSWKWITESRVECPFSRHHVAVGVEHRAEVRAPLRIIFNDSLRWIPPDHLCEIAFYQVKPYTRTQRTKNNSTQSLEFDQINVISTKTPSLYVDKLNSDWLPETTSEMQQEDSVSTWLSKLIAGDTSRLGGFQQRMFRLRYLPPENSQLKSVSLSNSFPTVKTQEESTDNMTWFNDTSSWDEYPASDVLLSSLNNLQIFQESSLNWTFLELKRLNQSEEDSRWNISAFASMANLLHYWLDTDEAAASVLEDKLTSYFPEASAEKELASFFNLFPLRFGVTSTKSRQCYIFPERVLTYDGVEYFYTLNECHHLLTADCARKTSSFAVTAHDDILHGISVRLTLERDTIDIFSNGTISFNGTSTNNSDDHLWIHEGETLIAIVERKENGSIHFQSPLHHLNLIVEESSIILSINEALFGQTCGLCGDGDSETTGEFKTSGLCALSSGALMAASFQVNVGSENCPFLTEEASQQLLKETYPCFSVDEHVASVLPLPPES